MNLSPRPALALLGVLFLLPFGGCQPEDGAGQPLSVAISAPATPPTLAAGESLDFAATASGGTPPYSYSWNFDADGAGGGPAPATEQNQAAVIFPVAGTFLVVLTATDGAGAAASSSILVTVTAAGALVLNLEPVRDNSIYSENNSSNGAGAELFAGRTNSGNTRRALLAFDPATLPVGAVISSVTLTVNLDRTVDSSAGTFGLHRLTENWGEAASNAPANEGAGGAAATGDATWNFAFFNATPWSVAGGAYAAAASATAQIGTAIGPVALSGAGLAVDVEFWRGSPGQNFGWVLRDANDDGSGGTPRNRTARRFGSRESTSASRRPTLRITYTLP